MLLKRLLTLILFAALTVMPTCMLHAQWVQTNGPYGSNVYSLLVNGNEILAGTDSGVFLSLDSGKIWESMNSEIDTLRINAIVTIAGSLYIGTDNGIFSSVNNGASWQEIDSGLSSKTVSSLAVRDTVLFAIINGGVYKFNTYKKGWFPIDTGIGASGLAASGSNLFVMGSDGVLVTSNDGKSWSTLNFGLRWKYASALTADSNKVYIASYDSSLFGLIFRSIDYGSNWEAIDSFAVTSLFASGNNLFAGTRTGLNFPGSGTGLFYSTNLGASWSIDTESNSPIAIAVQGSKWFAGFDWQDGLFASTDSGSSWLQSSFGLPRRPVYALGTNGQTLFAGSLSRIFISPDSGNSWTTPHREIYAGMFLTAGPGVYAGGGDGGVYLSTDNGVTWQDRSFWGRELTSLAWCGTSMFAGCNVGGLFRSTDSGRNWAGDSIGLAAPWDYSIGSLAVNGTYIYGGTDSGIYFSKDYGNTWTALDSGTSILAIKGDDLLSMSFNPLVEWMYSFLRSTDGGLSWQIAGYGLPKKSYVSSTVIVGQYLFTVVESYYNVDSSGVYVSTDFGLSWSNVNSGISTTSVYSLATDSNNLFAGTASGVWRRPLSEMIGPSAVTKAPPSKQNIRSYPNPLSHSTEITFTTEAASYADVTVVNLLGTEVAHLFSGTLGAGERSFTWNPTGLPDGEYECLVRQNRQFEKLPMMLMR